MVGEPHMSSNSIKAGQVKQNDWEPPCEVSLPELTELYFPCFSPAFLVDGKMSPEQGGSGEGRETQVLAKLSLRKWLLHPLARAYEYTPENSIFPVWTICILSNDGGYGAASLGIKTLDKKESDMSHQQEEVWIITCFEHFWSTILQRTILVLCCYLCEIKCEYLKISWFLKTQLGFQWLIDHHFQGHQPMSVPQETYCEVMLGG